MTKLDQLEATLLRLYSDREAAVAKHKKARLVSLDKDIIQLQNRINNLKNIQK
jgi:hypothetical protein